MIDRMATFTRISYLKSEISHLKFQISNGRPDAHRRPSLCERTPLRGANGSFVLGVCLLLCVTLAQSTSAQLIAHPDQWLDYVYPAGGQQGQTIEVEFGGVGGLAGANKVLVEGPPGITVTDVVAKSGGLVTAKLAIAADAPTGRRTLRVAGGTSGLTNNRPFFVGAMAETREVDPNDSLDKPQDVTIPVIVNGRLEKTLDVDCFRLQGKAGQSLVCAIAAHGIDSSVRQSFQRGFLDTSLELLDASGQVVAEAEDTLGLDPILNVKLPAHGAYTVRVKAVAYQGAPSAVYRLTLGEVPYITSLFPAGGKRGETIEVELAGPNVPPGTRQKVTIPAADKFPLQDVTIAQAGAPPHSLPFVRGDFPESLEREPNQERAAANLLAVNSTVNGRFETPGDEDWYRLTLAKGQGVILQTLAQRHLRAPVDTLIEMFDATGKKLAQDDDASRFMGQAWHDFESVDSLLVLSAPADGDYFVRLTNGSGVYGPASVYRLSAEPYGPDFALFQWPDAVPIWGPGTTATFLVQVFTWGGLDGDVQLTVEGLPAGWKSGLATLPSSYHKIYANSYIGGHVLMTITAPADAAIGTIAPFRVVGRAMHDGKTIEHEPQCLTLYGNSHNDRMFLRYSRSAQVAIAPPLGWRIETPITELTVPFGGTTEIPVKVERTGENKGDIGLAIDGTTVFAGCAWKSPTTLPAGQSEIKLPFTPAADWKPGTYTIVVSRSWASDLRSGRPGPCTPAIKLVILPPK